MPELLNRSVLREQLRERILQRILDGDYAPGERIVESHLMKEYGVSPVSYTHLTLPTNREV